MHLIHSPVYHSLLYKVKQAYSLSLPIIENLPWVFNYKKDTKPDILIYSSRRGGSTLLSQIISASKGIRYIDQPFDQFENRYSLPAKLKIKQKYLPLKELSQFITLNEEEAEQVKNYLGLLTNGKLIGMGHYWRASRSLLKICNALNLIDFLSEEFHVVNVYMTRHPVPQTLSVLRNKWGNTSSPYLKNEKYCSTFLPASNISKIKHTALNGTDLEKGIVNWCLENNYILKHSKAVKKHISYESLVLDKEVIKSLATYCKLNNVVRMEDVLVRPSKSSVFSENSTRNSISKGNRQELIEKWTKKMSSSQFDCIQKVLDLFEIDTYEARNPFPKM